MSNLRSCRIIEVIETEVLEGEGTPKEPFRIVKYYSNKGGTVLAVNDPTRELEWDDKQPAAKEQER